MIIAWIGYCLLVSALLGLAALTTERALGHYRKPVRAVWITALVGSVALPIVAYVAPALVARFATVTSAISIDVPGAFALGDFASTPSGGIDWSGVLATAGLVLGTAWLLSVIAFAGYLAVAHGRLRRDMAAWTPGEILDAPVLMTRDVGPAVVGFGKAVIVMPAWISELEDDVLRLVFLHEREHMLAGDNRLFGIGLLSLAAMPWNPIAWWQLRRLRLAIEFDCDGRVMAHGVEPRDYAEALLAVGGRLTSAPLAAAAFAERRPAVERRLRRMTEPLRRLRGPRALAGVGAGMVAVLFACGSPMPTDSADADALASVDAEPPAGFTIAPKSAQGTSATEPDPLFVLDGVIIDKADMQALAKEAVERVDVLKGDAALAEFGDSGRNGVVRITTKAAAGTNDGTDAPSVLRKREAASSDEPALRVERLDVGEGATKASVARRLSEAEKPLIVIDGVIQATDMSLEDIKAHDIDQVEVVKGDAARALYGERAKNGVVQITTKSGG
jgi:TonB-dependent SusC/RagA subfamily outer membrane receptor